MNLLLLNYLVMDDVDRFDAPRQQMVGGRKIVGNCELANHPQNSKSFRRVCQEKVTMTVASRLWQISFAWIGSKEWKQFQSSVHVSMRLVPPLRHTKSIGYLFDAQNDVENEDDDYEGVKVCSTTVFCGNLVSFYKRSNRSHCVPVAGKVPGTHLHSTRCMYNTSDIRWGIPLNL